jgi:hypothetical protein
MLFIVTPLLAVESEKKLRVPSDAAQAEATKLIKEVYGDEYAKAKTLTDKQALAKKLLGKANESKDDPADQFDLTDYPRVGGLRLLKTDLPPRFDMRDPTRFGRASAAIPWSPLKRWEIQPID